MSSLTPYLKCLYIAVNAQPPALPTEQQIADIRGTLLDLGWSGQALEESTIRQGLTDLAMALVQESQ